MKNTLTKMIILILCKKKNLIKINWFLQRFHWKMKKIFLFVFTLVIQYSFMKLCRTIAFGGGGDRGAVCNIFKHSMV
jgi:hypothetical protein